MVKMMYAVVRDHVDHEPNVGLKPIVFFSTICNARKYRTELNKGNSDKYWTYRIVATVIESHAVADDYIR